MQARELQVSERYSARKSGLLRSLSSLVEPGLCRHTVYLSDASLSSPGVPEAARQAGLGVELEGVVRRAGESHTGLVLFWGEDQVVAVAPPFPVDHDSLSRGLDVGQLEELLSRDLLVGVVLLRLGRYAAGVLRGDELVASKSGSRYVKSRHRAGGSSQRRFERSRERLVRELFDKACEVAGGVFAPFGARMDYMLLGGERHTLRRFAGRCSTLRRSRAVLLPRTLEVGRPGRAALEQVHHEVWSSRVVVFTRQA